MDKKRLKAKIKELLESGMTKTEVYRQLSTEGVRENQLAYSIASYIDPHLRYIHDGKVNILVSIMLVYAAIGFMTAFNIGAQLGPDTKWVLAGLGALMPLLFAWGFYSYRAGAYNIYLVLTIANLPVSIARLSSSPIDSTISLVIATAMLAYVWYLRGKLFPDFSILAPRKKDGEYVFSD